MLEGADSEPWHPPGRRREIDARLDAVRARLQVLGERDVDGVKGRTAAPGGQLEAARRHVAEAHVAAAEVLASSAEAFLRVAEVHERAASRHDKTAAAGIGDVIGHERHATVHWAAAAAARQRAERAQSLLSNHQRAGTAAVCDEPGDGVAL